MIVQLLFFSGVKIVCSRIYRGKKNHHSRSIALQVVFPATDVWASLPFVLRKHIFLFRSPPRYVKSERYTSDAVNSPRYELPQGLDRSTRTICLILGLSISVLSDRDVASYLDFCLGKGEGEEERGTARECFGMR